MKRPLPFNKLVIIIFSLALLSAPKGFGQSTYREVFTGYKSNISDSLTLKLAGKIKIYPVPVNSELFAENISIVTMIEIFDVTGNKRISEVCDKQDQIRISVSQLARGVYFIRFITPRGTVMKRFIKE